ncbi:hypothetical protein Tco_0849432 [Tanacetum coccineum]
MANLKFTDTHNMVVFLSKPAESERIEQIMDFLNAKPIKYALTIIPTIYTLCIEQFWDTVKVKIVNGEVQLQALVDEMKIIITESTVRRDLQLKDAEGVDCLPNATIFEQLALMRTYKIKTIQKESVESDSFKSSTQNSSVNDFIIINIPEEDVEPKQIILGPDNQPMWESVKTVAPTSNSAIIQLDVDDNFVINSTHLNMIRENKFDGYLRADPHDHIREFLAICNMFRYGETQSEVIKLLIFPFSLCDKAKTWFNELNEESITSWEQMRRGYQNQDSHNSFSRQSHHDPNDSEKSLTELNNDMRNDLEDFKRRIRSMRTVHWKLYDNNDGKTTGVLPNKESKTVNQKPQSKTDLEKSITKFLDG